MRINWDISFNTILILGGVSAAAYLVYTFFKGERYTQNGQTYSAWDMLFGTANKAGQKPDLTGATGQIKSDKAFDEAFGKDLTYEAKTKLYAQAKADTLAPNLIQYRNIILSWNIIPSAGMEGDYFIGG